MVNAGSLREAFDDDKSRVVGSILAIDIVNSTQMKADQPESDWITTYGRVYDLVATESKQFPDARIIKYLGDGMMIHLPNQKAQDAINLAIKLQETLKNYNRDATIKCVCSAAIASGKMVRFSVGGSEDYIGTTVDRAFRLCSAASQNAIFVDGATIDSANLSSVSSKAGDVHSRSTSEYKGDIYKIELKGFKTLVEYYEILWDVARYGLKNQPSRPVAEAPPAAVVHNVVKDAWVRGTVYNAPEGKPISFVRSDAGEEFFAGCDRYIENKQPQAGQVVFFIPSAARKEGELKRATNILVLGETYHWSVDAAPLDRDFVFVSPSGTFELPNVYCHVGESAHGIERGASAALELLENPRKHLPTVRWVKGT